MVAGLTLANLREREAWLSNYADKLELRVAQLTVALAAARDALDIPEESYEDLPEAKNTLGRTTPELRGLGRLVEKVRNLSWRRKPGNNKPN